MEKRRSEDRKLKAEMPPEMPRWFKLRQKANEPAPLDKKWSVEEKESILDYVHGEIPDDEVKACCYYEFARASETLRKARREYNPADPENSLLRVSHYFPGWVTGWSAAAFWTCHNFPDAPWRGLSKAERENVRVHFGKGDPRPIVTDVLKLQGMGVFDAFTRQAQSELEEFSERATDPRRFVFSRGFRPAIANGPLRFIKHVVVTINYTDGVDAVKKEFARWLASEANQKLFNDYYKKPIPNQSVESLDYYKEHLKYLAAWRLYDERGFKGAMKWTKENRRRYQGFGHRLPFFAEKLRKTPEGRHYEGPVFKEGRQWKAAIAKAKDFLAREIESRQSANPGIT